MDNAVRDKLVELLARDRRDFRGGELCFNQSLLASYFSDHCPLNELETSLLVTLVELGAARDLLDWTSDHGPLDVTIDRWVRALSLRRAIEENAARWAVLAWATALGRIPAAEMDRLLAGPARPPEPIAIEFHATPDRIQPGASATLRWKVTAAATVTLTPGPGDVTAEGALVVKPAVTTTYTLAGVNAAGRAVQEITIVVAAATTPKPAPARWPWVVLAAAAMLVVWFLGRPPAVISFEAPAAILVGQRAVVHWKVERARRFMLNGSSFDPAVESAEVSPDSGGYVTLKAESWFGDVTRRSSRIKVLEIRSFTVSPRDVGAGGNVTLSWEVSGSDGVTISDIGAVAPQGSRVTFVRPVVVSFSAMLVGSRPSKTFTLTASAGGLNATRSVTVSGDPTPTYRTTDLSALFSTAAAPVSGSPSPQVTQFKANPGSIRKGEEVTLTWDADAAWNWRLMPPNSTVTAKGQLKLRPAETTNYMLFGSRGRLGSLATTSSHLTVTVK